MPGPRLAVPRARALRLLPAAAVLLIGCAWVAAAATHGDYKESFDLKHESAHRAFTYRVMPGTVAIEVELEANVPEGRITGRVLDPAGVERLELRLEGGRGQGTTGQIPAIAGIWKLELETSGALGHGQVRFASR